MKQFIRWRRGGGGARRGNRGAVRGRRGVRVSVREDAEKFPKDLRERVRKFGLELHPENTRLIEFGRYAAYRDCIRAPARTHFLGHSPLKPEVYLRPLHPEASSTAPLLS
jgi:hypothetical protein